QAGAGQRIEGSGVRRDRNSVDRGCSVVREAAFLGWRGGGRVLRTEHHFLVERGTQHDFHLVLYWHLAGRERGVDLRCRNLPGGKSSPESGCSPVQLAR